MTNMGSVHVICMLPFFFMKNESLVFIYETKNTEKC